MQRKVALTCGRSPVLHEHLDPARGGNGIRNHIGRYVSQWRDHEIAFPHTRMWDDEIVVVDALVVIEQHVNIESARTIGDRALSIRVGLQLLRDVEYLVRRHRCAEFHDGVEILGLVFRTAHGFGLVKGRNGGDVR
jgi:hypothetical protein